MPKHCGKKSSPTKNDTTWLTQFGHEHNLPEGLMEVLAEHHITSESVLIRVTEQDFANMKLVVGQEIILHRVIATLLKQTPSTVSMTTLVSRVVSPLTEVSHPSSLPPFKLDNELAKIEAEFCYSKAAAPLNKQLDQWTEQATTTMALSSSNGSNGSEVKPLLPSNLIFGPDRKHLKLTFVQLIVLGNFKILESIMSNNPCEATDYISYLKFLAIKRTRFQTCAILAFDQDYCATKLQDDFTSGSNVQKKTLAPSISMQQSHNA